MKKREIFTGLFLLKLLDVITTLTNIGAANMVEMNPLINPLISSFGVVGLLVVSLLGSAVLAVVLEWVLTHSQIRLARMFCVVPFVMWGIMPIINYIMLGYALRN